MVVAIIFIIASPCNVDTLAIVAFKFKRGACIGCNNTQIIATSVHWVYYFRLRYLDYIYVRILYYVYYPTGRQHNSPALIRRSRIYTVRPSCTVHREGLVILDEALYYQPVRPVWTVRCFYGPMKNRACQVPLYCIWGQTCDIPKFNNSKPEVEIDFALTAFSQFV